MPFHGMVWVQWFDDDDLKFPKAGPAEDPVLAYGDELQAQRYLQYLHEALTGSHSILTIRWVEPR